MIKSMQQIHTQLKMEKKHEQSKNTTEYIIVVSIGIFKFCFVISLVAMPFIQ